MRRFALFAGLLISVFWSTSIHAQQPQLTAGRVKRSIDLGVRYLKSKQNSNGSWEIFENHTGGVTSLCTLALLNAGVDKSDRTITRALRRLDGLDLMRDHLSVYTVSIMTMIY